jgi:hypothetical protein
VFYEDFIKFIPPYILKREEERRKKAEKDANVTIGKPLGTSQVISKRI